MTVHFIGAGPGAPDLITVRGLRLLERARVVLYAGALVPEELLGSCRPDARLVDTAHLDLDAIIAEMVAAHERGEDVARLQSGDLSIFSAVAEQVRRLEAAGVPYEMVPGVPAFAAAAASLGRELTVPWSRVRFDITLGEEEAGRDPHAAVSLRTGDGAEPTTDHRS